MPAAKRGKNGSEPSRPRSPSPSPSAAAGAAAGTPSPFMLKNADLTSAALPNLAPPVPRAEPKLCWAVLCCCAAALLLLLGLGRLYFPTLAEADPLVCRYYTRATPACSLPGSSAACTDHCLVSMAGLRTALGAGGEEVGVSPAGRRVEASGPKWSEAHYDTGSVKLPEEPAVWAGGGDGGDGGGGKPGGGEDQTE
eukprot:SAG22_NODE_738_length_7524_cov_57.525522_4_plen_196_part_00